jgi:putative hemolysin
MPMKSGASRLAGRFRDGAMFPGLMFRPGQAGRPLKGRRRFAVGPFSRRFQPPKVYGRIGSLEVRLARKKSEIRRAQRLRYKVFYEEMSATPNALAILSRRDEDAYDPIFDHLLVMDRAEEGKGRWRRSKVVGTYRLLRQEVANRHDGFYTQGEYDIAPLVAAKSPDYSFMELGRSCVLKPYRNRRTIELLWQGIWSYVQEHGVDVMVGCASFEGTDPTVHAEALSFLHHTALAPEEWRVRAHEHLRVDMNMMPEEAVSRRAALKALPPLIKGYLRAGAFVGDGAVIDRQFGTVDVFIILPVAAIQPRYTDHFGGRDALAPSFASELVPLN